MNVEFSHLARTGDFIADCGLGTLFAQQFVTWMRTTNEPFRLGWLAKEMVEAGRFEGVEVGFWRAIANMLLDSVPVFDNNPEDFDTDRPVVEMVSEVGTAPVRDNKRRLYKLP